MRGYLAIKDIGAFSGTYFGWEGACSGEVIKFQSMNFCWDILTDPAYKKKIVVTDSPAVDDRQPSPDEIQSFMPHLAGMVFLGPMKVSTNGSADSLLKKYFESNRITGFIPDRKELLRDVLEFKGPSTGSIDSALDRAVSNSKTPVNLEINDLRSFSAPEEFYWDLAAGDLPAEKQTVVVWDFGANYNLLRSLRLLGCRVRVTPPDTFPEDIVALHPDCVVISGGPAAARNSEIYLPNIERMIGIRPLFGVGGGAALLARALGIATKRLEFPHYGNSIAVEDAVSGRVEASYQTHSVSIDPVSAKSSGADITQLNVCDGTIEGFSVPEYEAAGSFCLPTVECMPGYFRDFLNAFHVSAIN